VKNQEIVFRGGSRTNSMLTPRAARDTIAPAGLTPGLSVEDVLEDALEDGNKKAQKLDLAKLKLPLAYFPDNPAVENARKGHGVITPVNAEGQVDFNALQEWALARGSQSDTPHPLTQLVIDAIIEIDVRRP
jgi:hypothetical protein